MVKKWLVIILGVFFLLGLSYYYFIFKWSPLDVLGNEFDENKFGSSPLVINDLKICNTLNCFVMIKTKEYDKLREVDFGKLAIQYKSQFDERTLDNYIKQYSGDIIKYATQINKAISSSNGVYSQSPIFYKEAYANIKLIDINLYGLQDMILALSSYDLLHNNQKDAEIYMLFIKKLVEIQYTNSTTMDGFLVGKSMESSFKGYISYIINTEKKNVPIELKSFLSGDMVNTNTVKENELKIIKNSYRLSKSQLDNAFEKYIKSGMIRGEKGNIDRPQTYILLAKRFEILYNNVMLGKEHISDNQFSNLVEDNISLGAKIFNQYSSFFDQNTIVGNYWNHNALGYKVVNWMPTSY